MNLRRIATELRGARFRYNRSTMTLSYASGPAAPIFETTIAQIFRETAAAHPDREALISIHQNVRLTYRELLAEAERTAYGLAGLGLQPGDRVGVWSANCVEWILLQLGCAIAGLVLVNVNPAYRAFDLGYVLRKSRMRALFLRERDARADYTAILDDARRDQDLALQHIVYFDHHSWRDMLSRGTPVHTATRPSDVANIQYTSGTTGSPKGVLLTHRNLVNNAWSIAEWTRITPADRMCVPLPLYHCAGC